MTSDEDASFLDEIARLIEAPIDSSDVVVSAATGPLLDDLSLLLLDIDSDDTAAAFTTTVSTELKPADVDEHQPPTTRSAACRSRQREELQHLRDQVRELEEQLDGMQRSQRSASPAPSSSSGSGSETNHDLTDGAIVQAALWERIAKHQMTAKQKAEVENAKLRELLEGQLKIARGLERVLRKRSSLEVDMAALDAKRPRRIVATDAAIYEQLRRGLDRRYREVESVFQQNGMASIRSDLEDVRVLSDSPLSELGIEILVAKVLPFDFARTSAAVWQCSSSSYLQLTEGFYAAEAASNDKVTAKFEIPLTVRRQTVTLHVYVALKRYRESDVREVYAWESCATVSAPQRVYDGIELLDHGWTVVTALGTDDTTRPATIVQCCSRLVPDVSSLSKQRPIGVLTDVLIASYNRNYATLYETVETALVLGHRPDVV